MEINQNKQKSIQDATNAPVATKMTFKSLFLDRRFFNYTWIGLLISGMNVFLLWLFIDILHIPTVVASIIVIGATFIIRYILLIFAKIV